MQESSLYINMILEAIAKIENSVTGLSKQEFIQDKETADATLMRLQVIGESIKKIPAEIKKKYKDIKWKKFERLRNIISHKYAFVNYDLIWDFIQNNLEELKQVIIKIKINFKK